ncbi:MAG: PfkB family carbohydrate kinase [Actinomycetales bacterium]
MAGTVYVLGSILVDLTVDVPALPARGGDVLASATRTGAGGGVNLATAVARQGIPCVYGGPHGTGPYGDLVRAALATEGIGTVSAARTDGDTGFCITLVEPDGERTFVTMPGVEAELRPGDLAAMLAAVAPGTGDLLALSGYDLAYPVSGPVLADWVSQLPPDGPRVVLDPGPLVADIARGHLTAALPHLWLLTLNQREARLFSRAGDASGRELVDAVRRVPALRPETLVVVREGAAGCVAAGGALGDEARSFPAPEVTAVDTTGAGDTHTGVLLAALADGDDVPAALTRANRAAAMSVTRRGPATAPTATELDGQPA